MSSGCKHTEFRSFARVGRILPSEEAIARGDHPLGFFVDLTVLCAECGTPFRFLGLPGGLSPFRPTSGFDGFEARLPIEPGEPRVEH